MSGTQLSAALLATRTPHPSPAGPPRSAGPRRPPVPAPWAAAAPALTGDAPDQFLFGFVAAAAFGVDTLGRMKPPPAPRPPALPTRRPTLGVPDLFNGAG